MYMYENFHINVLLQSGYLDVPEPVLNRDSKRRPTSDPYPEQYCNLLSGSQCPVVAVNVVYTSLVEVTIGHCYRSTKIVRIQDHRNTVCRFHIG